MSVILIQDAVGDSSIRELTKQLPIAVGRHSSNDIQVSEPDVEVLHCRISWNSRAYEVTSGSPKGVDVNGERVASAILTPGDCIQVGQVGIFYYDTQEQLDAALRGEVVEEVESEIAAPVPVATDERANERAFEQEREQQRDIRRQRKRERSSKAPSIRPKKLTDVPDRVPPERVEKRAEVPHQSLESEAELPLPEPEKKPKQDRQKTGSGLQGVFGAKPVRPGEQDPLRSPLVLGLGIGTVVLIMMSLALWFVIGRDTSNKAYQLALDEMDQKRFTQAIAQFSEFLKNYPGHQHASAARHALGLSQAEQPLAGAAPDWSRGIENLNQYLEERRRDKDFPEMAPKVADLAERIALGSAASAAVEKKPELLTITRDATRLLQSYSSTEAPPKQALLEIDAAGQKAELAIRQYDMFNLALKQIDAELQAKHPFSAFEVRRKLLLKYPALESDKALASRQTQILDAERKLATRQVVDRPALTTDAETAMSAPTLVLLRHTRTRPDTLPSGINVFTVVYDTIVAADSATGAVQWRRNIGLDAPFSPVPVTLDVLCLLVFDVRRSELQLLRQRDGVLVWRQSLSQPASAAPLIHAGQIFIPTRDGVLCQLDLVSGTLLSTLIFSQPLAVSPVLVRNGERMIVAGDRAVLYTLNYRPLECVAVTYTGHASGSIQAPMLKMGDFLLTAENDRQDSARLRVWDTGSEDKPLSPLAGSRVEGQVRDSATLRGKQLIVPSSPERLNSFTVSDEKSAKALTAAGDYQVEAPNGSAISVTLGPDDEMWMTSSALRRFQIGPDSLVPEKGQISLGSATQPAQVLDQTLFATSRVPSNSAISFLAVDRRELVSQWQLVMGGQALVVGTAAGSDGSVPLLLDTGDVFSISPDKLQAGGQDTRPVSTLPLPVGLKSPLQATVMQNGRLTAWCSGATSMMWQLNSDGIIARESKLPGNLEAAPISLSGGILIPLPEKLKLIEASGFNAAVEDLMPPIDPMQPHRWLGLIPIDDKQFIAVNDHGRVIRGQVRTEPVPHLAEVTFLDLKQRIDASPVSIGTTAFLITGKILHGLDMGTFETRGELALPDAVSQGPWVVDQYVILVCGHDQLVVLSSEGGLKFKWTQKLTGGSLAGAPLIRQQSLILATHSGQLTLRKLEQGDVVKSIELGQVLTSGPCLSKDHVFVTTQDGTIRRLNSWLDSQP